MSLTFIGTTDCKNSVFFYTKAIQARLEIKWLGKGSNFHFLYLPEKLNCNQTSNFILLIPKTSQTFVNKSTLGSNCPPFMQLIFIQMVHDTCYSSYLVLKILLEA
jgi:hypothetical protein